MTDLPWNLEYFGDPPPPDAPIATAASAISSAGFVAHWLAAARARSYLLYIATDESFASIVPGYNGRQVAGLEYNANDLEQGVDYYYRVTSENPYGESEPSNVIHAFTDFVDAPVAIAATDVQEDRFNANWNPVVDPDLDHYDVEVSSDGFATLLPSGAPLQVAAGTETLLVAGLPPETEFQYRVRAVKVNGTRSVVSNVIDVTTEAVFVAQGGDLVLYFEESNESVHIFDTIGESTFEVLQGSRPVRRLIVGGGAQGGGVNGSGVSCGGGGGGGVLDLDEVDRPDELVVGEYPVIVGKGGSVAGALNVGEDGDDSSFEGDTAQGGGHGGSAGSNVGNGGSGGGATNSSGTNEQGGLGVAGQGSDGGDCPGSGGGGGAGGGGASEVGGNGSIATGGKGGDGIVSDITGEDVRYGAGGGGGRPVDPFGVIAGTTPGAGGNGGGGSGSNVTPGAGTAGTGIGSGGGGSLGNTAGGIGTKGRVAIRYRGRAADITPPPEDPAEYRGPITFAGCTRRQVVDGVDIDIDCNSKNNTGIFPDYRAYRCVGGGVVQSSRWDVAYGPTTGNDGILVFRFSEPIRKFKITRRVTADVEAIPSLVACDDYTVIPSPSSSPPGSSQDGSIVGMKTSSPRSVYYPPPGHLEPPVDMGAEEEMILEWAAGFTCVVIFQGPDAAPVRTSEFVDPMFILLTD